MPTQTFDTVGQHTYQVPTRVVEIEIEALGGGARTANGGRIVRTYSSISESDNVEVFVGGSNQDNSDSNNDPFNGGGDGGSNSDFGSDPDSFDGAGASDVRINGTTLDDRIVVAGGAGGDGRGINDYVSGGDGGADTGGTGSGTSPGNGGDQSSGGTGPSEDGSFGQGGAGYSSTDYAGGGGGGGWYGGGGGGDSQGEGGGGGGSNYPASTHSDVVASERGINSGSGQVVIVAVVELQAPQNVSVDAEREDEIDISWDAVDNAGEYHIYRHDSSGAYNNGSEVGTTTSTTFTDTGLTDGKQYNYQVVAHNHTNDEYASSSPSSEVSGTTTIPVQIDSAQQTSSSEVTVQWTKADDNGTGSFEVWRSEESGVYGTQIDTASYSTTEYVDASVEQATEYYYSVRRATNDATSGYSSQVSARVESDTVELNQDTFSTIPQTWDEIALDDDSFVDGFGGYKAEIKPRSDTNSPDLTSNVESISYSPKINSAPSATVDIEPFDELEGVSSEDYLNGRLNIFVDGEIIFSGNVVTVNTNQNDDFYSVKAHSAGRRLIDQAIDESPSNYVTTDYIASVVDKYNTYDSEHRDKTGTSDETLSQDAVEVDENTRYSVSDGSTAHYSSVGPAANNISTIYVKAYTPQGSSVSLSVESFSGSDTHVIDSASSSQYGEWVRVVPSVQYDEEYSLSFNLDKGCVLFDWISITEHTLWREVDAADASLIEQDLTIYDAQTSQELYDLFSPDGNEPVYQDGTDLSIAQTLFVYEGENYDNQNNIGYAEEVFYSGDATSDGAGASSRIGSSGQWAEWEFNVEHTIAEEDVEIWVREMASNDDHPSVEWSIDGNLAYEVVPGQISGGPNWFNRNGGDQGENSYSGGDLEPSDNPHVLRAEGTSDEAGWYDIDVVACGEGGHNYNFDNSVTEVSDGTNVLDGPELYPPSYRFENKTAVSQDNVRDVDISTSLETLDGQSVQVSFDEGGLYRPSDGSENSENVTVKSYTGARTITTSLLFEANENGSGGQNATPRYGYHGNTISSWSVIADIDDLDVLQGEDFSGDRLSVISDIADSSRAVYRWEGDVCVIFQKGDRKTSPDLRKEEVSSSVNIEEVYSSCEVIGDDVESGVIESDEAPDFINSHRRIQDNDITTEDEAVREAKNFLAENGTVEYSGSIRTLPTRAPLGEELDGTLFNHGKDSFIQEVSYGKRKSKIKTGRERNFSRHVLKLDRQSSQ